MTRKEAVKVFFESVRKAYIEDQQSKGIRASGKSANSLRIDSGTNYGKLFGASYFHFQKVGRKPGGFPPLEAIIEWIKAKHIQADIPNKSLAFLIARKISKLGTDIYQGKRPGLSVEDKIEEARKALVQNVIATEKEEMIKDMKSKLQKANS